MSEARHGHGQRQVEVSETFIAAAIQAHADSDLPVDARMLRLHDDPDSRKLIAVFESKHWDGDEEAGSIPEVDP